MLAEREYKPLYDIRANLSKIPFMDLNPHSEHFFGTYSIPRFLNLGKNRISVIINKRNLVPNAPVYLQAIDSNGLNMPFTATDKYDVDGSRLLTLTVTRDTAPGPATLYIASRTKYHPESEELLYYSTDPFSEDFKDNVNIVWRGTLLVKKEISELPPIYSDYPSLEAYEMDRPYYEVSGSDRQIKVVSTASFTYHHIDSYSNYVGRHSDAYKIPLSKTKSIPIVSGNTVTSNTGSDPTPGHRIPVIQSTDFEFSKDMEAGVIELYTTFEGNRPPDALDSSEFVHSNKKQFTISRVISDSIAQIANPSRTNVTYRTTAGTTSTVGLGTFTSTSASLTYNADPGENTNALSVIQKQKRVNFLRILFKNLDPINGVLKHIHISVKPIGSYNPFTTLGVFEVFPQELLTDSSSYQYDSLYGVNTRKVGDIRSWADMTYYYNTYTYRSKLGSNVFERAPLAAYDEFAYRNERLLNSIQITQDLGNEEYVRTLEIKDEYVGTGIESGEYLLRFNTYCYNLTDDETKLHVYISGSKVQRLPVQEAYDDASTLSTFDLGVSGYQGNQAAEEPEEPPKPPFTESMVAFLGGPYTQRPYSLGTRIATIVCSNETRLLDNWFYFTVQESGKRLKPIFVIESSDWHISDIQLLTSDRNGRTPSQLTLDVPLDNLPVQKKNTEYVFKVNYLGKNEKPGNAVSLLSGLKLNTESNIDDDLITNTFRTSDTIQSAISGAFGEISSSLKESVDELNYLSGSVASMVTSSFETTSSHTFVHNMSCEYPIVQVFDSDDELFWPQTIRVVDDETIEISFSNPESGYVVVLAS